MGCVAGNLKYYPKRQHHKQQTGAAKTEERQRHSRQRKNPQHRPDIDHRVRKYPPERARHQQPMVLITRHIHDFNKPEQEDSEQ